MDFYPLMLPWCAFFCRLAIRFRSRTLSALPVHDYNEDLVGDYLTCLGRVATTVFPLLGHGTRHLVHRGWFFYVVFLVGVIYLPVFLLLTM